MPHNHVNEYYSVPQTMMFAVLGMLTKVWTIPLHLLLVSGGTMAVYFALYGWDAKVFSDSVDTDNALALFMGIVSSSIMMVLENYHRRITEAKVALAKAEEERAQAAEVAKAYADLKQREELIRIYVHPFTGR